MLQDRVETLTPILSHLFLRHDWQFKGLVTSPFISRRCAGDKLGKREQRGLDCGVGLCFDIRTSRNDLTWGWIPTKNHWMKGEQKGWFWPSSPYHVAMSRHWREWRQRQPWMWLRWWHESQARKLWSRVKGRKSPLSANFAFAYCKTRSASLVEILRVVLENTLHFFWVNSAQVSDPGSFGSLCCACCLRTRKGAVALGSWCSNPSTKYNCD